MLNKLAIAVAAAAIAGAAAYAQQTTTGVGTPSQAQVLTSLPPDAKTISRSLISPILVSAGS